MSLKSSITKAIRTIRALMAIIKKSRSRRMRNLICLRTKMLETGRNLWRGLKKIQKSKNRCKRRRNLLLLMRLTIQRSKHLLLRIKSKRTSQIKRNLLLLMLLSLL